MTSYDRYVEYVQPPTLFYDNRHQPQQLRHQLQQLNDTGGSLGPGWRTNFLDGQTTDSGPSILGRQKATTPIGDCSQRRPAPPTFTIDAILSSTGTTIATTSTADWSRLQAQQTTAIGDASTQLSGGIFSIQCSWL